MTRDFGLYSGATAPVSVAIWSHGGGLMSPTAAPVPGSTNLDVGTMQSLDRAVEAVTGRKEAWLEAGPGARAALLERCLQTTAEVAADWVDADVSHRQITGHSAVVGLEWLTGPAFVLRTMRLYARSMRDLERKGRPEPPGPVRLRRDGRLSIGVFPAGLDRLLWRGNSSEVWLPAGTDPQALGEHLAEHYRNDTRRAGQVCAVLGAGNLSSLAPNDVLAALFVRNETAVLKLSPVLAYHRDLLTHAFAPLVDEGFVRIVTGGADVAGYLAHHPGVDRVMLTGSSSTYDALVYGTGPAGARRKAADEPLLNKPVLAELGSVTPVIVVPAAWSAAELQFHAENVASNLVINTGATCVTPRVLVTQRQWPLRERFLAALRNVLSRIPTRYPYYPGTVEKYDAFLQAHPAAERLGTPERDHLPWILQTDLVADDPDEPAFVDDPFCGILSETPLDVPGSPESFLAEATRFCNERLFGNLNAVVIVRPTTRQDPHADAALERALAELRYGNVVVNAGPGLPYLAAVPPWGAYPGAARNQLLSGNGFVHNTYLFDDPEKSVTWAPFRPRPKPPWFVTHRHPVQTFRAVTDVEATHHPAAAARSVWYAARA